MSEGHKCSVHIHHIYIIFKLIIYVWNPTVHKFNNGLDFLFTAWYSCIEVVAIFLWADRTCLVMYNISVTCTYNTGTRSGRKQNIVSFHCYHRSDTYMYSFNKYFSQPSREFTRQEMFAFSVMNKHWLLASIIWKSSDLNKVIWYEWNVWNYVLIKTKIYNFVWPMNTVTESCSYCVEDSVGSARAY